MISYRTPNKRFQKPGIFALKTRKLCQFQIPFPGYHRHIITQESYNEQELIELFKKYFNPALLNGLYTTENIMDKVQRVYPFYFNNVKIRFTQTKVIDLTSDIEQEEGIITGHQRAHRNATENKDQLLQKYYFHKMHAKIKSIVKNCKTCKEQKFHRHPPKPEIQPTPIPNYPDKYSKYTQVRIIKSKAAGDITTTLRELLYAFRIPKILVFDNEKSFNSATISFLLKDE